MRDAELLADHSQKRRHVPIERFDQALFGIDHILVLPGVPEPLPIDQKRLGVSRLNVGC